MEKLKNNSGITLVALVVTIVVLIILAVISIGAVFGEDGIIKRAEEARDAHLRGEQNDLDALESLDSQIGELIGGSGSGGTEEPGGNDKPEKILVTTLTEIQEDEVKAEDDLGNKITVPKGFKVRTDLGDTVQEGIVIEDGIGNQYVWVPVSSTKRNNTDNPIIIEKDGVEVEVNIILGRYTFANSSATVPGEETLVQAGEEYANPANYAISTYYTELNDGTQESNGIKNKDVGTNTAFKDLKGFVDSVETNKGYYIARYEASYGGGTTNPGTYSETTTTEGYTKVNSIITDQKLYSVESVANSTSAMSYTQTKTLWNFITQGDAAKVCRNMYKENETVESDLMNSYAWDTAIVFIQKCSDNSNYANQNRGTNTVLKNTGSETGDVVCNIYDMAGNLIEWTTENSTDSGSANAYPCVFRGGYSDISDFCTRDRHCNDAPYRSPDIGFRSVLYNSNTEA